MRVSHKVLSLFVCISIAWVGPAVLGAALTTASAQAQPAAHLTPADKAQAPAATSLPEPAGYRPLVEEAKSEYDVGNFAEARALFAKANALFPNARALRGLGMAEFELRNYGDCVVDLEKALSSDVRPLEGTLRAETERLLQRARSFVARVNLAIEPSAAVVVVDGIPMPIGPQGNLVLEVGNHQLEFRAEGYVQEKRVVKVIGGEEDTIRVVLPREGAGKQLVERAPLLAPAPSATPKDEPEKKLYKSPWLWAGVGVAVAALGAGLAVGLSGGGGHTREPPVPNAFGVVRAP